ncbi:MAG: proton-conducting transporter membrane subunit [Pirellulales bacterium]
MHVPWLVLAVAIPLAGGLGIARVRDPQRSHRLSVLIKSITLICALVAWLDFQWGGSTEDGLAGRSFSFGLDELSAPLVPLVALLYLATSGITSRTKMKRFSFGGTLVAEAILLATLTCGQTWGIVALLAVGTIPPYFELRARGRSTRVYALHMALFVVCLVSGQLLMGISARDGTYLSIATILLTAAVLVRSGIVPLHIWMPDLFENATFGTALLFSTPMVGAYAAVRLLLPVAPAWALQAILVLSLLTAVYAAGMALVQSEARRFFCYLFISQSSLVLVGMDLATPAVLTGALSLWISIGLALAGFGLTLRAVEARTGRLSLSKFHGLYEHVPSLAVFFLLTGLASVGFPGTFGFVGVELLIDGAVEADPLIGMTVVFVAALNGIAVLQTFFRIFTGARHHTTIALHSRRSEKVAVLTLTALIVGAGLFPQPGIESRYRAAMEMIDARRHVAPTSLAHEPAAHGSSSIDEVHPSPSTQR